MEFSKELREDVVSGEITVSFRLWRRRQVSPGRRYRVGPGWIEVDSIELVPFSSIDQEDIRRAGEADLGALRQRAAHAGPIDDGTLLFRIEFHAVPGPAEPPPAGGPARQPPGGPGAPAVTRAGSASPAGPGRAAGPRSPR